MSEEQLEHFRREIGGKGLSSYPHPWLMPEFWQFPTVSMGLGPMMAIYQARFMRYLDDRGMLDTGDRKVWAFMGDGEMDEPESLGAISLAGRERLDNLIFVVNCNLQRLDGPVRGNGKIIQELEGVFRGAGWNVIKVIWGSYWDPLLARDTKGLLRKRMEEVVDGEYQAYKASLDGAFVREHFFGKYPELKAMVAHLQRRRHLPVEPRRPRSAQGLRRVLGGGAPPGAAHRGPGQDGQGLRHGPRGRGPEHHAPAEEAGRRDPQAVPRPLAHPGQGRRPRAGAVLPAARRQPGDEVPQGAARGAGRPSAGAAAQPRDSRAHDSRARDLEDAARGERRARDLDHDGLRARV